LLPASGGQVVKLRSSIVFGGAQFGRNPHPLDEPVQRRVQRTLFDLQNVVRVEFDGFGNGMAMGWALQECAENQQVQRPLQKFEAFLLLFSRHSR
jgi:hypothetical protein